MKLRAVALLAIPVLFASAGEVREEVLVVVNGHMISLRTFQQAVEQGTAALYRQFSGKELDDKLRDAREKTLQGLIDTYLIADKAVDLGIAVPDDYIRGYIEDLKKQNNITSDADFEKAIKGSLGISMATYLARTKQDVLKQEVLRKDVYSKIAIEDQELKAYYLDHKEDYKQPSRFRIRELILAKGATAEEQEAAKAKLATIQEELKKGTPFEALVKEHSGSPSRSTGGDLGWLPKGVLRQNIEDAALALKVNQVSAPLETDKDYELVQLLASEMDAAKPFADVRQSIMEKLQEPKAQSAIENYLVGLRLRANIRYMVPMDKIIKG